MLVRCVKWEGYSMVFVWIVVHNDAIKYDAFMQIRFFMQFITYLNSCFACFLHKYNFGKCRCLFRLFKKYNH